MPQVFQCSTCLKTLTRRFNLDNHQRAHQNIRPFSCPICTKSFTRKNDWKEHQRQTHQKDRMYPCTHCHYTTARARNLARHLLSCKAVNGGIQYQPSDGPIPIAVQVLPTAIGLEGSSILRESALSETPEDAQPETTSTPAPSSPIPSDATVNTEGAMRNDVDDTDSDSDSWDPSIICYQNPKNHHEVHAQATIAYIRATLRLDFLRFTSGLASGGVSWTYNPCWRLGFAPRQDELIRPGFNACGSRSRVDPIPSCLSRSLIVRGVEIDVIDSTYTPRIFEAGLQQPPLDLAASWDSFFEEDRQYVTGERLADVLALLYSQPLFWDDQSLLELSATPELMNEGRIVFRLCFLQHIYNTARAFDKWVTRFWESQSSKLFRTQKRYIGCTRQGHHSQVGDKCCVLFGCATPLMLTPVGDHFKLVGEAYIHGAMQGEIIKLLDAGKLKERMFEIR